MKKQHLSLITLALVASIMMGCKASSTKAQAANDIKEARAADTLVVNTDSCILQEGKIVQCAISVDYPTEPNELSKNIRTILNEELANLYLGNMNGDQIEKQVTALAERFFDQVADDEQNGHVAKQVIEAAVQEHVADEARQGWGGRFEAETFND